MNWGKRNRKVAWGLALAVLVVFGGYALSWFRYPSDRTPVGAYYRVMSAVNRGDTEALFPYLETDAQHAAFTIHDYVVRSYHRVSEAYPEPERTQQLQRLKPLQQLQPGPEIFAWYARQQGWIDRLRRDLSGVASVEEQADRATVQTVRGTRYPFRRRDNGMWGLTLFTGRLVADAEKAARDFSVIDAAASDYERIRDAP